MNEIVNTIVQLINGVGFPIAACIAMGWFIVDERKNREESAAKQREEFAAMLVNTENSHKASVNAIKQSVDANTEVIKTLIDTLKGGE